MGKKRAKLSAGLSGVAGEYFVAAELSRRGYIASITLRNTRGVDILVSNINATKSVGVQVKTSQSTGKKWVLNKKIETEEATNLFYVFVRLNELGTPEYYIVPKREAAKYAADHHKEYLGKLKRDGTPRKDSSMRKFADLDKRYLNRWDLLCLD
ncbi:MAG: hypothetical protein ACOYJ2_07055 [Rickettsiales bacterium]